MKKLSKKNIPQYTKESKKARYDRVTSGLNTRSTVYADRKKKARKSACRLKGGEW